MYGTKSYNKSIMNISTKKERLYAELKVGILEGRFRGKFPPEPLFARELNVSRNTLRSVYALLEADGLVIRHPGNGTMIKAERAEVRKNILFCYMDCVKHFTVDFIIPSIYQGAEKALPPEWGLESCPVTHLKELPAEKALQIFKARNICGLIIVDSYFKGDEAILRLLREAEIPAVLGYCNPEDQKITQLPVVAKCFPQAWQAGLDFLKKAGHRRIVTLNSLSEKIRDVHSREEYQKILEQTGLDPDPELILNLPLDEEVILEALKKIDTSYTAVYCYSDFYAQYLYRALKKLKRRVPEDVSVLGYCGYGGGAYFDPPLTTVELDYAGIGFQAVEILKKAPLWFDKKGSDLPFRYTSFTIRERESLLTLKKGESFL